MKLCLFLLVVFTASAVLAAGTPFTLVKDGKPACAIVIADKAGDNAKTAAQELQTYVEKISGARLPILTDAAPGQAPKVLVGRSRLTEAIPALKIPDGVTPKLREEGYILRTTPDALVLAGNDTFPYYGTRYAVCDFLNRLGVRWYTPGEYGEVIPKMQTVQIDALAVEEHPDFPVRCIWEETEWQIHNRMNPRSQDWFGVPGDSSLNGYLPKDQIDEHPEWFALQPDGTRNPGLPCMTDELRRNDPEYAGQPRMLDEVMKVIDKQVNNGARTSPMSPDDGVPACDCDLCRKMSTRFSEGKYSFNGDPLPEYITSQEWFFFINGLLEATAAKYPGHLIATNGYANRYAPPEPPLGFNRHQNLTVMFADILGCTIHAYNDPKCWEMHQQYEFLKKWCKISDKVWLYNYDYTMLVSKGTLTPMSRRVRANIPLVKEAGAVGFFEQDWKDLSQCGLQTYLVRYNMEWNTETDVDALLADYYQKWFGPAGAPMKDYYDTLETAFDTTPVHGHEDVILQSIYTPRVVARLATDIARAEELAIAEPMKTHVHVERLIFDHLQCYAQSLQAKREFRFADAAALMEKMIALKMQMRQINENFGWPPSPYSTDWEAERMKRLAGMSLLTGLPEMARFSTDKQDVGRSDRWMEIGYNDAKWQNIRTSEGWQNQGLKDEDGLLLMTENGHPYKGLGWYRFTLDVPAVPAGKQARIFCPAVDNQAWVWVNGQYAGRNDYLQAWFRPQEVDLDITPFLTPGKNQITLRVVGNEEYFGANGIYERPFIYTK